jgi:hypothetical protein
MADLNFPELTDEMLQKFIGHALQQATKEDTRSPLSSGLLTAGLAMMANSRGRNFGEALGQGGLLGLQAYGAQKELAKKDPTQMISLLTAVEGLKTGQQNRQLQKEIMGAMGQQQPSQFVPAEGMPDLRQAAYGMFDRGASPEGQSGYLGSMQAPPAGPMNIGLPLALRMSMSQDKTGMGETGRLILKQLTDLQKVGGGESLVGQTTLGGPVTSLMTRPKLPEGMQEGPGGSAQVIPEYLKSLTAIKAAESGGTASGALPFKAGPVPLAGGGSVDTTEQIGLVARQFNIPVPIARELVNSGIPPGQWPAAAAAMKNLMGAQQVGQTGVMNVGPSGVQTQPGTPAGAGGPALATGQRGELYGQPSPVQAAIVQAKGVQEATMPGQMNEALAKDLGKYSVENFAAGHKAAEDAAYTQLPAIQEVRKRIGAGAFTGGGAETKTEALNFLNGWLGTSIASPQIAQSQALKSALGYQVLANAKKLGANPTEADAKRIDDIVGKQGLSQEALLTIAEVQEKLANQIISRHNKRLDNMESVYKERGIPTDTITGLRVQPPEAKAEAAKPPQGATNLQLKAIEDEILRRRGIR